MGASRFSLRLVAVAFVAVGALSGISDVRAAAVQPASSGIKNQIYYVEWCSTHATEVANPGDVCRTGYFTTDVTPERAVGEVGIRNDGRNFTSPGSSAAAVNGQGTVVAPGSSGRTGSPINGAPGIPFFLNNGGAGFTLKGEGIYTIRLYSQDYAGNTTYNWVRYKVDKTAPNLRITGITENSDLTYAQQNETYDVPITVGRQDMWTQPTSGSAYDPPRLGPIGTECGNYCSSYTVARAERRAIHVRPTLYGIYFRGNSDRTNNAIADNVDFNVQTAYSDSYDGYLTESSPVGALTSGIRKMALYTKDGILIRDNIPPSGNITLNVQNLIDNLPNSQKQYVLRIYDNTYGASGTQDDLGNYSETAFYAVRDSTPPNMGGNGLAGTDAAVAQRNMLKFPDGDSVYDSTIYGGGQYFGRFLGATDSQALSYSVRDTGVTGNGTISGNGCTDSKYCNAGLSASSFRIEDSGNPSARNTVFTLAGSASAYRFVSEGNFSYDFSRVDNDLTGRNQYRYYSTSWLSPLGTAEVCDLVGNCFSPQLTFRVLSDRISDTNSTFNVTTESLSPDSKMLANGLNAYRVSYSLKDRFGNRVVPVLSAENAGNPIVKRVGNNLSFVNGLYTNQLTNVPSGARKAFVADKESDNVADGQGNFSESINGTATMDMAEAISTNASVPTPNGTYSFTVASRVPTKSMYPFLGDGAVLQLDTVRITASGSGPADAQYPKTDANRLGFFDSSYRFSGTDPSAAMVIAHTGGIAVSGTYKDFVVDTADYGKVSFNSTALGFSQITGRRMNFEFAPRALYGIKNMGVLTDGVYVGHDERLYKIDSTLTSNDYNLYQKNLVAYQTNKDESGVFNFSFRSDSVATDMNPGIYLTNFRATPSFFRGVTSNYHNLDVSNAAGDGKHAEIRLSAIAGMVYDVTKRIRTAFASALSYDVSGDTVLLPAYSRDIGSASGSTLSAFDMARNYFSDSYSVNGGYLSGATSPCTGTGCGNYAVGDIAITGLVNSNNTSAITNDATYQKSTVYVQEDVTRPEIIADVRRNVEINSAGFLDPSATSGKRWCDGRSSAFTVDQSFLNGTSNAQCTQMIDGETVSFIEGNATLDCWVIDCSVSSPRTIVVQSGSLYVKSNVTTLGSTTARLLLVSLAKGALPNVTLDTTAQYDATAAEKQGWMFVDPKVTNVDAFIVAQGPLLSYSDDASKKKYYSNSNVLDDELRNQLHIYGSVLSLNNIGGSRRSPVQCPYIVSNCTEEVAQAFDLTYLRRYVLIEKYRFTGLPTDTALVPYYPNSYTTAKRSGGLTGENVSCSMSSGLRCIRDEDFRKSPLFVERDARWDSSPSIFFRKQ